MNVKRILVIRFRRVGDAVLCLALCRSLKQTFPGAEIDLVLNEGIVSLVDGQPDVDRAIAFSDQDNRNIWRYLRRVWSVMRSTKYDLIVDPRSTVRTLFFSLFSLRTPVRIGVRKSYTPALLTHTVDNASDPTRSMTERNMMLLKPLEAMAPVSYCPAFRLVVGDAQKQKFRAYMEQEGIDFSKPVILAVVITRLQRKAWPAERMQEVLRRMLNTWDAQVVLNFATNEAEQAQAFHDAMGNDPRIFTNIKAPSLQALCALSSNCDFFFGNEGGARHIAQAVGTPAYAIYSPFHSKGVWLPNPGKTNAGIDLDDVATPAELEGLDFAARFKLITVDRVWSDVDSMFKNLFAKK
ncbi:glycosyltransferase family 9 protein [Cellvibrio polysaccharolyticus]|uniref:Lipopolysaccharide heptosyltransferase family protein n=1 Tax=Cellvibrio polysaccharolyticus TaxID=2082724 RepID=A0A928YV32_9GAMM|nr:glycosyltransferase family 9 protein [Cellvibrio polysaccharolyticus]MBE8718602.1 lipopolysaccharide heptosyltransferase family protein [Cellvibrio polysaccharolyticus]